MADTDVLTIVASLAWVMGILLGYAFGFFAGVARTRQGRPARQTARGATPPSGAWHSRSRDL